MAQSVDEIDLKLFPGGGARHNLDLYLLGVPSEALLVGVPHAGDILGKVHGDQLQG